MFWETKKLFIISKPSFFNPYKENFLKGYCINQEKFPFCRLLTSKNQRGVSLWTIFLWIIIETNN